MTEPPLFGPSVGPGPSPQGDTPPTDAPVPAPETGYQPTYQPMAPLGDPVPSVVPPPPGPESMFPPAAPSGPPAGPPPSGPLSWSSTPAYVPVPTGQTKSGGSRGPVIAVILVAVIVVAIGAFAALALIGSGPNATPAASVVTPVGVVVFSDDFHDAASGWSTDTLPSGTTYAYTSKGFVVHAVGALHHVSPVPHGRERQRIVVSTTATQSSPAPDAAGFGVSCDRGTDASEIRYEFIAFADGTWSVERLDGPLSTTGHAPDVLKSGSMAGKPGAVPMTVEGTCITQPDGVTTKLAIAVNGATVGELNDTATALEGAGWYAELVVVSDDPPTDVTVTHFEVRTLP